MAIAGEINYDDDDQDIVWRRNDSSF
jgi:hypothetical protein